MTNTLGTRVEDALYNSVQKTFSDMAFIDVAEHEKPVDSLEIGQVVSIRFSSPVEGQMILGLTAECKQLLVENIYGQDWEELTVAQIDDCLLEVLNVLAGHFLHEYCGEEERHFLSLPSLHFDVEEIRGKLPFHDYFYDAEGHQFQILLRLELMGTGSFTERRN